MGGGWVGDGGNEGKRQKGKLMDMDKCAVMGEEGDEEGDGEINGSGSVRVLNPQYSGQ